MLSETVKAWPAQWMAKGREEGREKGREENQVQTAMKMVSKGINIELISEITGLTREQIEKLSTTKNRVSEPATKYKVPRKTRAL